MSQTASQPRPGAPAEIRVPVAPGVALHAERRDGHPEALPFVLVHGLASNLRLWDGVAEARIVQRSSAGLESRR